MPGAEVFLHKKSGLDELLFHVHNAIGHADFCRFSVSFLNVRRAGPGIRGASDEFALRPTANGGRVLLMSPLQCHSASRLV